MSALLWGLLAAPGLAGAGLAWAGVRPAARRGPADRVAPAVAVTTAAVALGLAVAAAWARPTATAPLLAGVPARFSVDTLGAAMVVTVAATTLVVLVYAAAEIRPGQPRARFCGLVLVFEAAMLVTVTAGNLGVLLMGWEVMGAMSYALIAFHWSRPEKVSAGTTAFLTTRGADLGLYLAAGAALAGAGSLDLGALARAGQPWLGLVAAGVILAAAGKSAQLPLSYWLAAAMQGPTAVSALLHSATMVAAGGYLLLRTGPLLSASGYGAPLVAWLGVATAVGLGMVALVQTDLKQLLAASTSAQIGFVVLAAGVAATAGGTTHLVGHAAVKTLLFLVAGVWLMALGADDLPALVGAARRGRLAGTGFTVGAVTLAGVPPLALWSTKDLVLAGARRDTLALYLAGLVAAALSAGYAGRALAAVWHPGPPGVTPATQRRAAVRAGPPAVVAIALLALATLGLTVLAAPAVSRQFGGGPHPDAAEMVLSAAVALGGVGVAMWWGLRTLPAPRPVRDWWDLRRAATVLVVRPTLVSAAALARADDRGPGAAMVAAATGTVALARRLQATAEQRLDGAVAGVVGGVQRLGRLARRPQTGQVHTYLAQAAVALVALGVVLVLLAVAG